MKLSITPYSEDADAYLRLIELGYQYRQLLNSTPMLLQDQQEKFQSLRKLFEGDTDSQFRKRNHRRFITLLPVVIKSKHSTQHAMLHNFSGNGLYLSTTTRVNQGDTLQVKIGRPGNLEYLFTCTVRHSEPRGNRIGLGCCIEDTPVEMRFASDTQKSFFRGKTLPQNANLKRSSCRP